MMIGRGQFYIVGSIQTKRTLECGKNKNTSNISIVIHNATLVSLQAYIRA